MTTHDELFADALAVNMEQFGEEIIYRPRGGMPRPITAIVVRHKPAKIDEAPRSVAARMTLTAWNDCRRGIASDELDTGGDQVDVRLRVGGPFETRSIGQLISDRHGATVVEVR